MRIFKNTFYIDIYSQIPLFSPTYMHIYKLLYYPLGTITFLVIIHLVCVWISGKYELSTLVACQFLFFYFLCELVAWCQHSWLQKNFCLSFFSLFFCLFLAHCHCNIHTNTEAYGTNRDI